MFKSKIFPTLRLWIKSTKGRSTAGSHWIDFSWWLCKQCDYESSRADILGKHVKIHNGEKSTAQSHWSDFSWRIQRNEPIFIPNSRNVHHIHINLFMIDLRILFIVLSPGPRNAQMHAVIFADVYVHQYLWYLQMCISVDLSASVCKRINATVLLWEARRSPGGPIASNRGLPSTSSSVQWTGMSSSSTLLS